MSALQYLLTRNFKKSTIIQWQLGLCPDWKVYTPQAIASQHYTLAEKAGLVKQSNGSSYDVLHHRITIPIHNAQGKLVGFAGRVLPGTDGPKYINPTNTPLYNKDKILFGLHLARKGFQAHGMACLVEGYLDVIKLHQHGWTNAIASCGTALTEGQAKELKRYTDTVLILRDGDKAGRAAAEKDISILAAEQFTIYLCMLPDGEDPDSLFDNPDKARTTLATYVDAIEWLCEKYLKAATGPSEMASSIDRVVKLLALITSQSRRELYIKTLCKAKNPYNLKPADLAKPLDRYFKDQQAQAEANALDDEDISNKLPAWVNKNQLFENGFVQLPEQTKTHAPGIYVLEGKQLDRVTNFTITPLYHIYESSNNRRLVEVNNGYRTSVAEIPTNALVTQNIFETELLNKGNYITLHSFNKRTFKQLTGWLSNKMPIAYELKTLGWQPEGFFAFSNACVHDQQLVEYDELGMIKIEDKHYMSLGNSKIHRDERQDSNPYENDLFLKYVPKPATGNQQPVTDFSTWATLFHTAYPDHAAYGIAFTFVTLFKDLITRTAKMPMLYCYGQKGSGKSSMAESITWLFFSGKDSEGKLIKGYNLNPGQGTPFSFFNRIERFRNCPILFNEFDENVIEDWKFGTFKAAYDGEGREVGDGDTGKKRKTKIQKVQGTLIIVGQYLSVRDDGSVASRSIPCQFSLERMKNLTDAQVKSFNQLRAAEDSGISYILTELMQLRPYVQKHFATEYSTMQVTLMEETRKAGHRVEARLISNYSLILAATKIMADCKIQLPYSFDDFYTQAKARMLGHNRMLKDNNIVNQFWKAIEVLFDMGKVRLGYEIIVRTIPTVAGIDIKEEGTVKKKYFDNTTRVLLVRFSNLYSAFAEYNRQRGSTTQGEETILMYLKEQGYFVGLTPTETFNDKRTSAYVFNYDAMESLGIVLEKNHSEPKQQEPATHTDDLPF